MTKRFAVLIGVMVALLALAGGAGAQSKTIAIGLEAPLTGSQSANGIDQYRGALLAVEQINRNGGVAGRKLRLVKIDDKADPDIAKAVAAKAIRKGIFAVVGPYNSSVGVNNLLTYLNAGVIPVQMTSTDDTTGYGVTVQPKNSQISPVEVKAITGLSPKPTKVAMLVDPSTYTQGMADRLQTALTAQGIGVTAIEITPGKSDYTSEVAQAMQNQPDLIYSSTYYDTGAPIAQAIYALGAGAPKCFMGLANQENDFVTLAGRSAAQACLFSGVPTPQQFTNKKAKAYVRAYTKRYKKAPSTWGTFTYDSIYTLANAVRRAGGWDTRGVFRTIKTTRNLKGATGSITISPSTGNRTNVPIAILEVNAAGKFVVESVTTGR